MTGQKTGILLLVLLCLIFTSSAWLDSSYPYRESFNATANTSTTLSNFPIYVVMDTGTPIGAAKLAANCSNLIFGNSTDFNLQYQVNSGCGGASTVIWVTDIVPTTNLTRYAYYGSSNFTNKTNYSTWDSNFVYVGHMESQANDSTVNRYNSTLSGSYNWVTGKFGSCWNNTAVAGAINIGLNLSTLGSAGTNFSVSYWFKRNGVPGANQRIMTKHTGGEKYTFSFRLNTNGSILGDVYDGAANPQVFSVSAITDNAWHHVALVRDATNAKLLIYIDGINERNATDTSGDVSTTENLCVGGTGCGGDNTGTSLYFDEIRVSNVARSPDWIKQESFSGSPAFGPEEPFSGGSAAIYATLSASLSNANETENSSILATITGVNANITEYNISMFYNQTLIRNNTITGVNISGISLTSYVMAPLVPNNSTTIPWNVTIAVVQVNSSTTNTTLANTTGNQAVYLYYIVDRYSNTSAAAFTVEGNNTITITQPNAPIASGYNVTYPNYSFVAASCSKQYGNSSYLNTTCTNTTISNLSTTSYGINQSHFYEEGVIYRDYFVNTSYLLIFNATSESFSSKNVSWTSNASREYYVWMTNSTNGTLNSTVANQNMTTTLNITFWDEITQSQISVDSIVAAYTVLFNDSTAKNYSLDYGGSSYNNTVRGYPDIFRANLSGTEIYSKTNYTTRSRFILYSSTLFNSTQNVKIFLLPNNYASYVIINVVNSGNPVPGAYIQILKYYSSSGSYLNVEQKITNLNGQAPADLQLDAFYKFTIYDSSGRLLYLSPNPEQFICSGGTCSITIDISQTAPITFISPYIVGNCSGNNLTNAISFIYSDYTGQTHSGRFMAWRYSNTTTSLLVCNQTFAGSSGSYACPLVAPENLSTYAYQCEIRITASQERAVFDALIDLRTVFGSFPDWLLIAVIVILGLGLSGINPIVGIIGSAMATVILQIMGVLPINSAAPLYLLIVAASLVMLFLPREAV